MHIGETGGRKSETHTKKHKHSIRTDKCNYQVLCTSLKTTTGQIEETCNHLLYKRNNHKKRWRDSEKHTREAYRGRGREGRWSKTRKGERESYVNGERVGKG